MTTSSSINFELNAGNLVRRALQKAGILGAAETPSAEDQNHALDNLNMLIKHWMVKGAHLWTEERGTLFLTKGTRKYSLGTGGAHAANSSDVVNSTLSGDEATSQTMLSITSTTGMSANDVIGIVLDDGTVHWTTISTVDSSTQVTVASGLASAAANGNRVYTYTSILERPLKITQALLRNKEIIDRQIHKISRKEYFDRSDKTSQSDPINFFYEPTLGTGTLYLYPTPDTANETVEFVYSRTIEDFDATSDTADLPQEWHLAIVYGLAALLADDYALFDRSQELKLKADILLDDILNWDNEISSIMIEPDLR